MIRRKSPNVMLVRQKMTADQAKVTKRATIYGTIAMCRKFLVGEELVSSLPQPYFARIIYEASAMSLSHAATIASSQSNE